MEVNITKYGRGVFATTQYKQDDVIEVCPVIVLSKDERSKIDDTKLFDYYFSWGTRDDQAAIALGFGSLYNHSYTPNAKYVKKFDSNEVHFVALKIIKIGEEILVNYNGNPKSIEPLWFEVT